MNSETVTLPAEAGQKYMTCKITIVSDGLSDKVIKVFPAEQESEKIWLNHRPGIERWEAVKRFMYQFAPRGTAVPEPVAYHSSNKNLAVPDITEADIPVVQLEQVLKALPAEERHRKPETNKPEKVVEDRIGRLEKTVDQMAQLITVLVSQGKTKPEVAPVSNGKSVCLDCNKEFKNAHGLDVHRNKQHKS